MQCQVLAALLLFVHICCAQTVCTVGPLGSDFFNIQDGLDGCNGGQGDIRLRVNTSTAYIGPLVFPDALRRVIIDPVTPGRIVVFGAGHFVDPLFSMLELDLTNITWDGLGTDLALFEPRLTNTNFTCNRCFYRGFNGTHVFRQEACDENTKIVFRDNVFSEVPANAVEIYAAESIIFDDNTCARCCGDPNVTFGSVFFFHIHQISRGQFVMSFNAQWCFSDEQPLRCRWFLDQEANVRCNQVDTIDDLPVMELQCFDRIATVDADFCQIGTQTFSNPLGGNVTDVVIVDDYLPLCRSYRRCTCNAVEFVGDLNGTEISIERPLGDVFYGGRGMSVPDTLLPCIPIGPSTANGTFTCNDVFNQYSDDSVDETTCSNAYTSGVLADEGEIENPCVCPPREERLLAAQDTRDEEAFPCRYSNQEGVLCNEEVPYCCAEPHWSYEDARYNIEMCASALLDTSTTVRFSVNFTQLFVYILPGFNSTHFDTTVTLINVNGVFGPVSGQFQHGTSPVFVLDGETIVVDASLGFLPPTNNMVMVAAVLEGQAVSASGTLITDGTPDIWSYMFNAYGKTESTVFPSTGVFFCETFEETIGIVFGELDDPDDEYDGTIEFQFISISDVVDTLELVFEDEWNNTAFTRVQVFVDGSSTYADEVFIVPPGSGVLNYMGVETINVVLGETVDDDRFVELNVTLPGESETVDHRWEYVPGGLFDPAVVLHSTAFGLWFTSGQEPEGISGFDYFDEIERVPVFFDVLLQSGCSDGVDTADCYFFDQCDTINCDQTVDECTVYSCFALFTQTTLAVDFVSNTTNTTGFDELTIGSDYRNGTVVDLGYVGRVVVNGTVLVNGTLVNITWEYRTYPLEPGALSLPSLDVLDQCDVVDTLLVFNSTGPFDYDSGWVFRPVGRWNPALMDPASAEVWQDPETWPAPSGLPIVYFNEPINRVADECCTGLYRECSCAGLDPSLGTQNVSHPYWPDSNYTCRADLTNTTIDPWCDCSNQVLTTLFPPRNDTVVYYIAHLPPTLSFVQMIENRAQQLTYGAYFQDTPYELVNEFSFAQPKRWDKLGLLREFYDNDNEFVTGARHDLIENPPPIPPRFPGDVLELDCHLFCDLGCKLDFTTEEEFTCIVDQEATPDVTGWGDTVFENITDAIARSEDDNGCRGAPGSGKNRTILARYTEQYYDETMDITKRSRNMYIASLDSARIVGSAHEIDGRIDTLTFQGMQFVHARENKKPIFLLRGRDLDQFDLLNDDFFGEQVRSGGIMNGRRVDFINIVASSFNDFEQYALRIDDTAQGILVENVRVFNSVGRVFFFKFDRYIQLINVDFIEVRGGADYKEAAIMSARARSGQACQEWADPDDDTSLVPAEDPNICKLIKNHQIISVFDEDERDQCFWLDRGNWNAHRIRQNRCVKAQYGFTGSRINSWSPDGVNGVSDIRGGTLEWFSIYNPLVQNTIFRNETRTKLFGWDYRLRSPVPRTGLAGQDVLNFFVSGRNSERNFGDLFENRKARDNIADYRWEITDLWFGTGANRSMIRCEVNNNFDDDFMPYRAPFPEFPLVYFTHGFHHFHNVSLAALYCTDGRVLRGEAPTIFLTSYNGSRIRQDNISLVRDTWLVGDTSHPDTWCRIEDGRYPVVAGHDHRASTPNLNMTLIAYWLDFYEDLTQTEIWRTQSIPQRWMILDRIEFDGRSKVPRSQARVYDFDCGEIVELPLNSAGEIRTNKPIPPSQCLFEFYEVVHKDFIDFEGRVVDPVTGERELVDEFPFTDGGRIRCLNAFNADTNVFIRNSTWQNMDREALYIENCLRTYIVDSKFYNISGRSRNNRHAVFIEGNPNNNTAGYQLLYFVNNNATQEKDVLFSSTGSPVNPAEVTSYWIHGYPNETLFCFLDNAASGLRVGGRFTAMQRSILTSCLGENVTIPFFPDRKRELRSLCVYGNNSNVKGSFHDMIWDQEPGTQDRWRNNEWCDNCCPLEDPDICYVDAIPEMCVPENPWFDRFFFCSINRAIERCISPIPFIYVIGRQNIFGWFPDDIRGPIGNELAEYEVDYPVPFKTYCEEIDAMPQPRVFFFNLFNETGNFTYNVSIVDSSRMRVGGAWGHQICARSHAADLSRDVKLSFEGLNFTHCDESCTPGPFGGPPTWDQPSGYNSTGLHLNGNIFNGAFTDARPHDGVFDTDFKMEDNRIENYTGDFGSRFIGRNCDPDTLMSFIGNRWGGFPGEAVFAADSGSLVFDANRFVGSGGQVDDVDWVAYVSQCNDSQPGVYSVRDNRFREIDQTAFTSFYKAGLWLGNVLLETKKWVQKRNCIDETIEVAIRYEYMPGSDRALLSSFMLDPNDQLCADGTEYDLVEGPQSIDSTLQTDPNSIRQRWCNDGCAPRDWFALALIIAIALFILLVTILCGVYFCCPSFWNRTSRMAYSRFLGIELPANRHQWVRPNTFKWHHPDPSFNSSQMVPRTEAVAPGTAVSQSASDSNTGGWWLPRPWQERQQRGIANQIQANDDDDVILPTSVPRSTSFGSDSDMFFDAFSRASDHPSTSSAELQQPASTTGDRLTYDELVSSLGNAIGTSSSSSTVNQSSFSSFGMDDYSEAFLSANSAVRQPTRRRT